MERASDEQVEARIRYYENKVNTGFHLTLQEQCELKIALDLRDCREELKKSAIALSSLCLMRIDDV